MKKLIPFLIMATTIICIGHVSGNERLLNASIEAWQENFSKATILVVGDECELPKKVGHIGVTAIGSESARIVLAAQKTEAEFFIYANEGVFPLTKISNDDIDLLYANPNPGNEAFPIDFATGLPRRFEKSKVLELAEMFDIVNTPLNFESKYFNHYQKGNPPIVLRDLADNVRLKVLDRYPGHTEKYRIKHLIKHKKFLVTNRQGFEAFQELNC